jgi:shikimate kinase
MLERHVFLIGMPGSGKTSLGKKVSGNLRVPFIDMDKQIADAMGMTIPEIFEKQGEETFRTIENNMLIHLTREAPSIISTGGGVCLREENRALMHNHGLIVLIDRPIDDIMLDIRAEKRPYLAQKGREEVERIYNERMPIYRSAADVVMDNGNGFHNGLAALEDVVRRFG